MSEVSELDEAPPPLNIPRFVPRYEAELLTPEQVLVRYKGGPKTGVFTDGSCEGNPGPGGWGFAWVEDDRIIEVGRGVDPATTNNRMELAALIAAYRKLPRDFEISGPAGREPQGWFYCSGHSGHDSDRDGSALG